MKNLFGGLSGLVGEIDDGRQTTDDWSMVSHDGIIYKQEKGCCLVWRSATIFIYRSEREDTNQPQSSVLTFEFTALAPQQALRETKKCPALLKPGRIE